MNDVTNQWRPLLAVLANPTTRQVAALMMLGADLDTACAQLASSTRPRVIRALVASGLVEKSTGAFREDVFRSVLESSPPDKRVGVQRFVDGVRVRQYPANLRERGELLQWVARNAFVPGEVLSESEVNERLLPFSDDVAVLRRYLVDYQLVERRSDGTAYALSGEASRGELPITPRRTGIPTVSE